jgi:signal transduction histidine kinase
VARKWRIRHKLMVELGLVVGIMALLLGGTLKGLLSYSTTVKSIESKLAEYNESAGLLQAVADLGSLLANGGPTLEGLAQLERKVQQLRSAKAAYEEKLRDTLARGRDPQNGEEELKLLEQLDGALDQMEQVTARYAHPGLTLMGGTDQLGNDAQVTDAMGKIRLIAEQLRSTIWEEFYRRTAEAKASYRSSITLVIIISVVGMVLMVSFLRYFYPWVFNPIRDLQQGVQRVAQGDFEHRIAVHSGDEMEDLAAAFNDMTDRLRVMYRDLEHQVNERSRQLVRSEHLASVGFLAAGVAHEINNPMASIAFCSEALESRLADVLARAPGDSEVITRYLQMIQKAAFRCKEITQRLLEFSRGSERRREPTDLAELIQSVLDLVEHLPNCKGKRICFAPPGRIVARVNAQEINSVVLNLVVNALDSMEEGGMLTIGLLQRGPFAELVFSDTGCGMTPEVLENIFEPFFTRSRTGKGTGLGLSISHRIISQHGGEITALSPGPNQGSTFTVRLPLQPAEAAAPSPVAPQEEETLGHAAA